MRKRILSTILTLCLIVTLLPTAVFAADGAKTITKFSQTVFYEVVENGTALTDLTTKTITGKIDDVNETISGVSWECTEYSASAAGYYTATLCLPTGYTTTATLPKIFVIVKPAAEYMLTVSKVNQDSVEEAVVAALTNGKTKYDVTSLTVTSGNLTEEDWAYIKSMVNLTAVDLRGCTTTQNEIPKNALNNYQTGVKEQLVSFAFPKDVTTIQNSAFAHCYNLAFSGDWLPDSVKILNPLAFQDCNKITSVDLSGVQVLGRQAFQRTGLTGTITLPDNLLLKSNKTIDNFYIFDGCSGITKIVMGKNITSCGTDQETPIHYIGGGLFSGTSLTEFTVPDDVEILGTIGTFAGSGCKLTIPNSVKEVRGIGGNLIGDLVIPNSVTQISNISDSNLITKLEYHGTATGIGTTKLIERPSTKNTLQIIDLSDSGTTTFVMTNSTGSPTALKQIDLSGCTGLTSVTIKKWSDGDVLNLLGCTALTSIDLGSGNDGSSSSGFTLLVDSNEVLEKINLRRTCVTLVANGGIFADGTIFTAETLAHPTKAGYEFAGWFTDENFTTEATNTNTSATEVKDKVYTATTGQTYYAKWTYDITFDANGGTGEMTKLTITDGDTTTALTENTFTRTGYTFAGWNTKPDGTGDSYADKAATKPSGNTTLYAQWEMDIGDSGYTVDAILDQTYTGAEIKPDVVVRGSDGVRIHENNYTVEFSNNKNVGTASVTVTMNEKIATVNFTIIKDNAPTVSISDVSVTYGTAYTLTPVAKTAAGVEITGENIITIKYYTNEACTEGETDTAPTDAGTYWAKATLTGTNNYAEVSNVAKITISNATFAVSAEGWAGTYDGEPHGITVTADGATITYCETEDGEYTSDNPQYTNAGRYTVYYKVSKANHNDVTGSVEVEITKINPTGLTITANGEESLSLTGGGTVTIAESAHPENAAPSIACSPSITPNEDGTYTLPNSTETYTFTASYPESTNYNAFEVSCTVSVTRYNTYIPSPSYYTLTFDVNGGSEISSVRKSYGTTIDLTDYVPTKDGYIFTGWYSDAACTDEITSVRLTRNTTVYAGWTKNVEPVVNPFVDVFEDDWYYDDVLYAYANGLMQGTSVNEFSPNVTTTRGMIVTILYRLEGSPNVIYTGELLDVPANMYYATAVDWAAANGILTGYGNGKFGPDDPITREQMAAILWRYAKYKGVDVSAGENTNILSYNDFAEISEYAIPAMQWVCGEGIIGGYNGYLTPGDSATRGQVAAILHRYCELIGE